MWWAAAARAGTSSSPAWSCRETPAEGDILAVCTTGAYNYSMASNYNRLPRPARGDADAGA